MSLAISNRNSLAHAYDDIHEEVGGKKVHMDVFEVPPVVDQVDEGKMNYHMMK